MGEIMDLVTDGRDFVGAGRTRCAGRVWCLLVGTGEWYIVAEDVPSVQLSLGGYYEMNCPKQYDVGVHPS